MHLAFTNSFRFSLLSATLGSTIIHTRKAKNARDVLAKTCFIGLTSQIQRTKSPKPNDNTVELMVP
jgi:hypothetical protein